MKNKYQITFPYPGLPFVKIQGESFDYLDLYKFSGEQKFMSTFNLVKDSESYVKFGESVTGQILYTPQEINDFEKCPDKTTSEYVKLGVFSVNNNLAQNLAEELKYKGINISDIKSISYFIFKNLQEHHDSGEKKVPGIIKVPIGADDFAGIDFNKMKQNLLIDKHNRGMRLTQFEKENFIGITLALNNRHIDSRILEAFGFNKESAEANVGISCSYYEAIQRKRNLTDDEKQKYQSYKDTVAMEKLIKLFREIKRSAVKEEELNKKSDILKKVTEELLSFKPNVLLLGERQVYWDDESYIHIIMRHIQEYQLGSFKDKTPFSYKVEDLENLINKVLSQIKEEYHRHILDRPESDFTRKGTMAVEFNGNHYTIKISPEGRLEQFHAW